MPAPRGIASSPSTSAITAPHRRWQPAPFSLRKRIDDLSAFLHELGARPAHLLTRSMGGPTVLGVAIAHPRLVRSAFLYEPAMRGMCLARGQAISVDADLRAMLAPALAGLRAGDRDAAVRAFFDAADGQPGAFEAAPAAVRAMALENAHTLPLQLAEPSPLPLAPAQSQRIRIRSRSAVAPARARTTASPPKRRAGTFPMRRRSSSRTPVTCGRCDRPPRSTGPCSTSARAVGADADALASATPDGACRCPAHR